MPPATWRRSLGPVSVELGEPIYELDAVVSQCSRIYLAWVAKDSSGP
jgi:hypothetical protein